MCQDHCGISEKEIELERSRTTLRGAEEKKELDRSSGVHSNNFGRVAKRDKEEMKRKKLCIFKSFNYY
jgi:hypothetical protein